MSSEIRYKVFHGEIHDGVVDLHDAAEFFFIDLDTAKRSTIVRKAKAITGFGSRPASITDDGNVITIQPYRSTSYILVDWEIIKTERPTITTTEAEG
jgi:hypothetical protein